MGEIMSICLSVIGPILLSKIQNDTWNGKGKMMRALIDLFKQMALFAGVMMLLSVVLYLVQEFGR